MSTSSARKAWIVAASVGVVEALKDHGVCRWNYAFRNAQQLVKSHVRSLSQAKKLSSSSSSSAMVSTALNSEKRKQQSEESLRTAMFLNCWGPN